MDGTELATYPSARKDAFEQKWSNMLRTWFKSGIHPQFLNSFRPFADGNSGLTVKVDSGEATINGIHTEMNQLEGLAISTADSSNDRIDRVVLTLSYESPYTIFLRVVTGTAQVSPVPPPLEVSESQVDIPVALVRVTHGNNSLDEDDITDNRQWFEPHAGIPASVVLPFFGSVAPGGYLMMKGVFVAGDSYPALAQAMGVDENGNIWLPDMTELIMRGANGTTMVVAGQDQVTLLGANMPLQTHTAAQGVIDVNIPGYQFLITKDAVESNQIGHSADIGNKGVTFSPAPLRQPPISVSSHGQSSPTPVPTVPRHITVNYIIKAH